MARKTFSSIPLNDLGKLDMEEFLKHPYSAQIALFLNEMRLVLTQVREKDEEILVQYVEFINGKMEDVPMSARKMLASYTVRGTPLIDEDGEVHQDIRDAVKIIAHIQNDEVLLFPPFIKISKVLSGGKLH
ncbi:MAG: hypothetical protein BMS9Abin13_418 [Patescibacteria group bacterium]|nr:MAG: hypothetical protein BMS9Abin13_418 [Patescibacteria group bacterium]